MSLRQFVNLQAKIFDALPGWMQKVAYSIRTSPSFLNWWLNPKGRSHLVKVLKPFHDKYKGCRCIVIGNGPSLRRMDLSLLKDEFTFGLNRIYLFFEEIGFETTFLVSVNRFVMHQFASDLNHLKMAKFFNWGYREGYVADENTAFLHPRPCQIADGNVLDGIYPLSGTVTNVALEIAYYMGFSEVILIGVDHSYKEKGLGNKAVQAHGVDQNHFSPEYFGSGVVWQLPDYIAMERGYSVMKGLFEGDERTIVDATIDGNLQIFPKVSFEEYLNSSQLINRRNWS